MSYCFCVWPVSWPVTWPVTCDLHFSPSGPMVRAARSVKQQFRVAKLHCFLDQLTRSGQFGFSIKFCHPTGIFTCSVHDTPTDFAKEVNKVIFPFIWNFKPDKMTLTGPISRGGLNMVNFNLFKYERSKISLHFPPDRCTTCRGLINLGGLRTSLTKPRSINSEIASLTKSLNLKVEDLLGITKLSGKSKKWIL